MLSFMFSVLGSFVFWVLFFVAGFFVGSLLMKNCFPSVFKYITTKERDLCKGYQTICRSPVDLIFQAILIMLFWPLVLLYVVIIFSLKVLFGKILWPSFCKGVEMAASSIPDIEIKKKCDD